MTSIYGIKVGRNDSCPCGSGKKYKKCCLDSEYLLPIDVNDPNTDFQISDAERQQSTNRLLKRAKEMLGDRTYIFNPTGLKMSGVILDLAKDMLKACTTFDQERSAIGLTCLAWNMAVVFKLSQDPEALIKDIENACANISKSGSEDSVEVLAYLVKTKIQLYPDLDRIIIDYDFVYNSDSYYLNIVSTPSSEEAKSLPKELLQKVSDYV